MIEIGRVCIKTAGRDAKSKCVVIDILDSRFVLVDGQARRKKVNVMHLEPTKTKLSIKKGAPRAEIVREFKKLGIELREKKSKKAAARPRKERKAKKKAVESEKPKPKK